jgi:hypothetical protein
MELLMSPFSGAGISKRTMKITKLGTVLLLFALFTFAISSPPPAHAQTYYLYSLQQRQANGSQGPPMPYDPYDGAEPIITLDASRQIYEVEDNTNDYEMLITAKQLDAMTSTSSTMSADSIDPNGTNDGSGGTYTNNFQSYVYGSNDLWLQVTQVDMVSQYAYLTLHGTIPGDIYQLLSTNQLNDGAWTLGQYIFGAADTNQTDLSPVYVGTNSQMLFRAHHANQVLGLQFVQDAVEPNTAIGDPGEFGELQLQAYYDMSNDLPVHYSISGTAQSGVDYSNLTGDITIPANTRATNIYIAPLFDSQVDGVETVTLTIQQTNNYLIDPNKSSGTVSIWDSSTTLRVFPNSGDAIKPGGPPGEPAQAGQFTFSRGDWRGLYPQMNAYYTVSGTASNGEDYALLSGTIVLPDGEASVNLDVNPLSDPEFDGIQTLTITLMPTNSYLVDPNQYTATINIDDSSTTLSVTPNGDAIKPGGPPGDPAVTGQFIFNRNDTRSLYPQMNAYYTVSGTASNGEDYTLLSGTLVFPEGATYVNLDVNPLSDSDFDGLETVTVTLVPTNSYFVDINSSNATINIADSSTTVGIYASQDAIETNSILGVGQSGIFHVFRNDNRGNYPQMTAYYSVSGTASSGVDYQTLSGTVTFASGATDTNIYVQTLPDNLVEGDETVTLTLIPSGNTYFIDGNNSNATVIIHDSVSFLTVASGFGGVIGIDYYTPSNSLLVSYNYNNGGNPFSLARIYTNIVISNSLPVTNVVITNWSGISGLPDEVYLATARMPVGALTNSAGFTNGDLFFGSGSGIGWLSADSTRSNLDWCILTNSVVTNTMVLRGGICMDQTGTFSNHIIAVTSSSSAGLGLKGIWRVDPHAQSTLIAQINTYHLEGVTTLTNDVQKWGPWAGKIITGDESHLDPNTGVADPVIYTIAPNSTVTTNETTALISSGIYPEDFQVIPPNQSLYLSAFANDSIMELPASALTNFVGDLLITEAGEAQSRSAGLFIVHWDSQSSNFVTVPIPIPNSVGGKIEHTAFAPIQLPGHY